MISSGAKGFSGVELVVLLPMALLFILLGENGCGSGVPHVAS